MKTFVAAIVLIFTAVEAFACAPEEFAADVVLWGETDFAGLVLSSCRHDAEVKIKVRIISRYFAPLASTLVVVRVAAGQASVFGGSFPPNKMTQAVPLNSQTRVLSARPAQKPADAASESAEPLQNADFADMVDAGPLLDRPD